LEKIDHMQWIAIRLIRAYRFLIRPYMAPACRFHPSCSRYAEEAIGKYGLCRGGMLAAWRICRCNPHNAGGYDPVK
jgi:putative membrane protein insertion efficiency factor